MSPRYGASSGAVSRLQSYAIARLHDRHDLPDHLMRSDLRIGSKVLYHVSASLQNFNGVRSQDPRKDASKRPSSDIVHINTRDILTMDWRRRAVEQAVQNARHLIQAYEEEVAESERRIAELYSRESMVSGEESLFGANGINQDCRVDGCGKEGTELRVEDPLGEGGGGKSV